MHSVIGSNVAPFISPGDWNHQQASKQTKQTFIPELCVNSKQNTNIEKLDRKRWETRWEFIDWMCCGD